MVDYSRLAAYPRPRARVGGDEATLAGAERERQSGVVGRTALEDTAPFGLLELRLLRLASGGAVCRIGRPGDQPDRANDGWHPSPDLGMLWFRWVDGHLACSGSLDAASMSPAELPALLDFIDRRWLGTDHQIDCHVDFVRREGSVVESGEESLTW